MGYRTENNKAKMIASHEYINAEHWKYPETVGNDTGVDNISFNSHTSSEYAIKRMDKIDAMTHEPFMLFEFMKVDNDDYGSTTAAVATDYGRKILAGYQGDTLGGHAKSATNALGYAVFDGMSAASHVTSDDVTEFVEETVPNKLKEWAKKVGTLVKRKYSGSIALYMPTDIQINDQMVFNEDSRKMGALIETVASGDITNALNPTTLTSTAALTTIGAIAGSIPKVPGGAVMQALLGAGLSDLASAEIQRASGKIANPNEILMYQSTAMRSFSFAWTILPDNADESKEAAGLIKLFRKSAHATKDNKMIITVPDHVIVSFHGAGGKDVEMIQLPPCVIESVNVTYNPNSSSFFKENNAPVEIGLAITLKEMAPIYSGDVARGY